MSAPRTASLCLLVGLAACRSTPGGPPLAVQPPDARVLAIADAIVDESLRQRPATLARLRPPGASCHQPSVRGRRQHRGHFSQRLH